MIKRPESPISTEAEQYERLKSPVDHTDVEPMDNTETIAHPDSRPTDVTEEMGAHYSSGFTNWEYKGEKYHIKFSHQAEKMQKGIGSKKEWDQFIAALCDRNTPDKSTNVQPYKIKINGLMAIYTLSRSEVFIIYAESTTRK